MSSLLKLLEHWRLLLILIGQRIRAQILRFRGAKIEPKARVSRHVTVDFASNLTLGTRVLIEENVYLKIVADKSKLDVGAFTFLGKGVEIDVLDSVKIGCHALIAPGCFITDHNHGIDPSKRIDQQDCETAAVTIGDDVWLGANCVILPGVNIGDGAVVAAAAVVNRDVASMDIVAGVPAMTIGSRLDL